MDVVQIGDDPILFDLRVLDLLKFSVAGVCSNVESDDYNVRSVQAIESLENVVEQNIKLLNMSLSLGLLVPAASLTRIALENLAYLYYIFSDSDKWNYRAMLYLYAGCQSLWMGWRSQVQSVDEEDISDENLHKLNGLRKNFYINFVNEPNAGLPRYVHYFDLSKSDGKHCWYFGDFLLRYPWNNDNYFDIRDHSKHYGFSDFFNDLGMFGAYSYLYVELSSFVHSSAQITQGEPTKVSSEYFIYKSHWFYYSAWLLMLMDVSLRLSIQICSCISSDIRCVNRLFILNSLRPILKKRISELQNDYEFFKVDQLLFSKRVLVTKERKDKKHNANNN